MRLASLFAVLTFASPAFADGEVDIRAFGDSGYIGGLGIYAAPSDGWVKTRLKSVEALRSSDVNFLNLEGSLTRSCSRFAEKPFAFAIAPEALHEFASWGFNLMGLANNHSLDCLDPAPGRETVAALQAALTTFPNLQVHGVASSFTALATRPALLTVKGVKLGMTALKAWGNGRKSTIGNLDNRADLMTHLAKADVDVRILSLHGGIENSRHPTDVVMGIAREFIANYNGDIVFAHHPHKSQGFEVVTKRDGRVGVIFYSLGNGLHNGLSAAGDGLAVRVKVSRSGVDPASLAVYPLARPAVHPRPFSAAELPEITSILRSSSVAIALRPLPRGLTRVPFDLVEIKDPVLGLKLAFDPRQTAKAKSAFHKIRTKAVWKQIAKNGVGRAAPLPRRTIALERPAARWIAPSNDHPRELRSGH